MFFSCLAPELKTNIRKLDHETTDLKFLNNQYVHKVRCLEKDSKAKSERIQQLQEKNLQAVVQTPGTDRGGVRPKLLDSGLKMIFHLGIFNLDPSRAFNRWKKTQYSFQTAENAD